MLEIPIAVITSLPYWSMKLTVLGLDLVVAGPQRGGVLEFLLS